MTSGERRAKDTAAARCTGFLDGFGGDKLDFLQWFRSTSGATVSENHNKPCQSN